METPATYLQLVFLASTVTPALAQGWAFTATPAPRPYPTAPSLIPPVLAAATWVLSPSPRS